MNEQKICIDCKWCSKTLPPVYDLQAWCRRPRAPINDPVFGLMPNPVRLCKDERMGLIDGDEPLCSLRARFFEPRVPLFRRILDAVRRFWDSY